MSDINLNKKVINEKENMPFVICKYTNERCYIIQCYAGDCLEDELLEQDNRY